MLFPWKAEGFIWALKKPFLASLAQILVCTLRKREELILLLCFWYSVNLVLETTSADFLQFLIFLKKAFKVVI